LREGGEANRGVGWITSSRTARGVVRAHASDDAPGPRRGLSPKSRAILLTS
jgi:hypothetical protein